MNLPSFPAPNPSPATKTLSANGGRTKGSAGTEGVLFVGWGVVDRL